MTAINPQARVFVNSILNEYDSFFCKEKPNIPDIFNPGSEADELKESTLKDFAESVSNPPTDEESDPPKPMTAAQLDAGVVANYKTTASTLSHLFALTGMLDAPLQDPNLQKAQLRIIEAVAQDYLRNKQGYELDPLASMIHSVNVAQAEMGEKSPPLPCFFDGTRRFYADVFQEVFSQCTVKGKKKIIKRLKHFKPELNTRSNQFQRVIFKIERIFNDYLADGQLKFGVSFAFGVITFFAANKTIALAGQFFASPIFTSFSTVVINRMPVVIVLILSGAYTRIVNVVVYVASSRWYQWKFGSFQPGPQLVCFIVPTMSWVLFPAATFAKYVFSNFYQSMYGPDAKVRMGICKGLEASNAAEAEELLDGGMKAYQIWMYLVEKGPKKGLFETTK